ncbi:hypothetical protein FRC05_006987 [Tulasnella sp. 425]|nr:hypothetical protein FRC05_006987 [Tulasnella sp. 425]
MQELAVLTINSISLFFLGILRYISTRIGPTPVDDARQIEQHPMPAFYVQYRQNIQSTVGWLDEYWPIIGRWARTFLDCFLPHDANVEELAIHGPTNQGPYPIPTMVVPRPPPLVHHED